MSACEKCWSDAGGDPLLYMNLIKNRKCSPEEQAGPGAGMCPRCGRQTLHQYTSECMTHGCAVLEVDP